MFIDTAKEIAGHLAKQAKAIPVLKWAARAGFVVTGILHILIGWLAIASAFGSSQRASQAGALEDIAGTPGGRLLLLAMAACAGILGLWRMASAPRESGLLSKLKMASLSVIFLYIAWTCATFAVIKHRSGSTQATSVTAFVLQFPAGRLVIIAAGLVVMGAGIYSFVKGATRRFFKDLDEHPGTAFKLAAILGYCARGIAFIVLGAMVIWAALSHDPDKASGLDSAFSTIGSQPFGQLLLVAIGTGFALYGVYSMARARYTDEVD